MSAAPKTSRAETLPEPLCGPEFSSYAADDVAWLLSDLSGHTLETTGPERERALQSGTSHYAESLPVEYEPTGEYLELFERALGESALLVARAVAAVGDQLLAARDGAPVLVSLARAGTPPGILIRRWLRYRHGVDAPHYTMSIVLGRGLDPIALRYLAAHHDPASVAFVDGWTGKGTITAELEDSLSREPGRFPAELAVLVDPAGTARYCGTRDDVLVPSACLNSTVSGLVSRTVDNPALRATTAFHGAKFYSELRHADRSDEFLTAIEDCFSRVGEGEPLPPSGDPERVRAAVTLELARLSALHGVATGSLVKPGVCETTRVLLRRVPELVIVREPGAPAVAHIETLARDRGVRVLVDERSLYAAVGIVRSMPDVS